MVARKYTEEDIKNWISHYNQFFCLGEISRRFGVHKSIISKYFKKYKNKFKIKYKDEMQNELYYNGKRLCLPLTGCGQIKYIDDFYFRKDSGKYKEQCKACRYRYFKDWKSENKDHCIKYNKEYGKKNRKRLSAYEKERKKTNIQFRLIKNIRSRVSSAIKGQIKVASAIKSMGCAPDKLKEYLENKFQDGMTWDNYGYYGWHIDHIRPLASFDLTNKEQFSEACHYTNLQPLWAKDNFKKGDKRER